MCVLNMHCICFAKNYEIKSVLTKQLQCFIRRGDSISENECCIDFKNTWNLEHCFSSRLPDLYKSLIDLNAEMTSSPKRGYI